MASKAMQKGRALQAKILGQEVQVMIFENSETKENRRIEIPCPMDLAAPFKAMKKVFGPKKADMKKWFLVKAYQETKVN